MIPIQQQPSCAMRAHLLGSIGHGSVASAWDYYTASLRSSCIVLSYAVSDLQAGLGICCCGAAMCVAGTAPPSTPPPTPTANRWPTTHCTSQQPSMSAPSSGQAATSGGHPRPAPDRTLYFARVPPCVPEANILALFQICGPVRALQLYRPWASARSSKVGVAVAVSHPQPWWAGCAGVHGRAPHRCMFLNI
jgi:hypothetical protein